MVKFLIAVMTWLTLTFAIIPLAGSTDNNIVKNTEVETAPNTIKIGINQWYTEKSTFAEIISIAQKERKPVMIAFTGTWCVFCQRDKKKVLSDPTFKQVADEALLVLIEETEPEGKDYVKNHEVTSFPTYKLYSPEGFPLSRYQQSRPRTLMGILSWVKEEKAKYEKEKAGILAGKKPYLIMNRFNLLKQYKKAIAYGEKILAESSNQNDIAENITLIKEIIRTYLNAKEDDKAVGWLERARRFFFKDRTNLQDTKVPDNFFDIHQLIIEYHLNNKKKEDAEKFAIQLFDDTVKVGEDERFLKLMVKYSVKHGLHVDKTLKALDKYLKDAVGFELLEYTSLKADLLCKMEKQKEAYGILTALAQKDVFDNYIGLIIITTRFVELNITDLQTLVLAKRVVKHFKCAQSQYLLACVYAALGKYEEAMNEAQEALKLPDAEQIKINCGKDMQTWQKEIKK